MNFLGRVCDGEFTDTGIQELLGSSPCIAPCMLCFQCCVLKSSSACACCHALCLLLLIYGKEGFGMVLHRPPVKILALLLGWSSSV